MSNSGIQIAVSHGSTSVSGVRTAPAAIRELRDDLAVEISRSMQKRGLRYCDLRARYGYSESQVRALSEYLRGTGGWTGYTAALALAERLGIPVRILVGDEARQVAA